MTSPWSQSAASLHAWLDQNLALLRLLHESPDHAPLQVGMGIAGDFRILIDDTGPRCIGMIQLLDKK